MEEFMCSLSAFEVGLLLIAVIVVATLVLAIIQIIIDWIRRGAKIEICWEEIVGGILAVIITGTIIGAFCGIGYLIKLVLCK